MTTYAFSGPQIVWCLALRKLHLMWRSCSGSCWLFDERGATRKDRFSVQSMHNSENWNHSQHHRLDSRANHVIVWLISGAAVIATMTSCIKIEYYFYCSVRPLLLKKMRCVLHIRLRCTRRSPLRQANANVRLIYSKFNWHQQQHHCFPSLASIAIIRTRRIVADSIFIIVTCRSTLPNV